MKIKIAIVFTCHNRIKKTERCLISLRNAVNRLSNQYEVHVFICDDASTDGTIDMIKTFIGLTIHCIDGTGNLFWAKGMVMAMEYAEKIKPNYYLMINDDVFFFPPMLNSMLDIYNTHEELSAVVGCTIDDNGKYSYGGFTWDSSGWIYKKKYRRVMPGANETCKWANWNCFLLPSDLYNIIGPIDNYYEHGFADYDYSSRIIQSGYSIYVASEYIGICNRNNPKGTYLDRNLPMIQRFLLLHKRTARPPKSCWHYAKKFFGLYAPFVFLEPYVYILITSLPLYKKIKRD